MVLVQHALEATRSQQPTKTALICCARRFTYADVDSMADRFANALIESGVGRGDRVAICLPNGMEAVVAIYGILKAGAVFVVVNPSTKFDKLSYILGNCRATCLVTDAKSAAEGIIDKLRAANPSLQAAVLAGEGAGDLCHGSGCLEFDGIQERFPARRPAIRNIDLDLACIIYTSGSTGEPKGVMSDHSNMVFAANSIISYLKNTASDVVLDVLPLSFDYGLYQLLMTFTFGGTLVLESTFAYPVVTLQRIAEHRVTGFPGVPTIFASLLQMDLTQFDLSSLRYITNTAAALPSSHIQELRRRFPGVTVYSMYGLTETKRTLYLPPDQIDTRPDSVGIPIPGTEAWIEGPGGVKLGPNQIGELVVRGRHVMRGYWEAPEATAARYRPGPIPGERLCYTGDLFRTDEDGYFYYVGRQDDIIKTRGEKVAPKEVENVLYSLAGISEAAVVGVPDPILGQAIKAVVVANGSGLTKSAVLAHCKARLEDFMVPKYVEFSTGLPKSASGKIVKKGLQ